MAGSAYFIYINGSSSPINASGADNFEVTQVGLSLKGTAQWTYSGTKTFKGFASSQGATSPLAGLEVGKTLTVDEVSALLGYSDSIYIYSVEGVANRTVSLENLYEFKQKIDETVKYKALYHLGEYDSVDASNSGYDVITRGTGYYNKKSANLAYYTDNSKQRWEMRNAGAVPPASLTTVPTTLVCNYSTYTIKSEQGAWDDNSGICITSTGGVSVYTQTLPDDFEIQYELAAPYTEKVLKNQPISQLDQNGENWLRGEYEKTLNLSFVESATTSSTKTYVLSKSVPAGTYTISFNFSRGANDSVWFEFGYGDGTNHKTIGLAQVSGTITSSLTCSTATTFYLKFVISSGTLSASNIMLNSGSTAKPFVDYNGPVMHAIDVEGVKLWENGDTNSNFSSNAITLSDTTKYQKLVVAYKDAVGATNAINYKVFKNEAGTFGLINLVQTYPSFVVGARQFVIDSSTQVTFGSGFDGNATQNNSLLIPTAIYGIK